MGKKFDRAYGALTAEKQVMSDTCKALILQDLQRKLGEYFQLSGEAELDIKAEGGVCKVTLSFEAERIKHFQVI